MRKTVPRLWLTLFLLTTLFVSPLCAQELPTATPEEIGLSSERLGRIDRFIQASVDQGQIPGAVFLIFRHGSVGYLKSFGIMDEGGKSMATNTMFRIASMTKAVTSVAAMMLMEEGRLLLNDPVSKYLPEFRNPTVLVPDEPGGQTYHLVPAKREITVRHLLSHTSGISYGFWGRPHLEKIYKDAGVSDGLIPTEGTIAEGVRTLARLPLMNQPGEAWEYGLNTDVLGRLVEVVSGMPLDRFFQERIFDPLAMTDTHFFMPTEKLNRLAAVYTPAETGGVRKLPEGTVTMGATVFATNFHYKGSRTYFSGGAGLVSTASDYARFLALLLSGGELEGVRLLSPKTVALMTANHVGDLDVYLRDKGYGFGLGFAVLVDPAASGRIESRGEYNWGGFFYTRFWVDPEEDLLAVMMCQLRPYTHLDFDQKLRILTYQALVD